MQSLEFGHVMQNVLRLVKATVTSYVSEHLVLSVIFVKAFASKSGFRFLLLLFS